MNTKSTLKERIITLINAKSTSPNAFSKLIKINNSTFACQLRGENEISMLTINAIAEAFPTLSMEWLIRGNGSMWHNRDMSSTTNTQIGGHNNTINTGTQSSCHSASDPRDEKIAMLQQQIDFMMNLMKMNANK